MAKALTDRAIAAAKPRDHRYELRDGKVAGLYLVVQPTGVRSWAFRYRRPGGRPAKHTIGGLEAYPLGEARKAAMQAARLVAELRDPAAEKKQAKAKARDTSDLVGALLDVFVEKHVRAKNRLRTAAEVERLIRLHVRRQWEDRKVGDLTPDDVHDLLEQVAAPIAKNRAFAVVRKFFRWLISQKNPLIRVSPAAGIQRPTVEKSRDRVLRDEEIRLLWQATEGGAPLANMMRLLLLTGQRRVEVSGLRRSELRVAGQWEIPAERAKNGAAHKVPLVPTVVEIIDSIPRVDKSDYVLTTNGEAPVSGFSRFKTALDKRMLRLAKERGDDFVPAPWRFHDLRRTMATMMAERLDVGPHVIEAILNHVSGSRAGVAGVYNRARYQKQMRAALEAWATEVDRIVSGSSNVVPLPIARSA